MPILGDPSALESLAARYDRHAACVRSSGRRLRHAAHTAAWECDAAECFRADVRQTDVNANALADEMCSLAQQLRSLAAALRREIAELMAIEARVRQLLADLRDTTNPPWAGTCWHPAALPSSCDDSWRAVGRVYGV